MPKVKNLAASAAKWAARAGAASADYADGAANPRKPWAQAARDAAGNYKAGVQAAAAAGRFEQGVARAGDEAYQRGVAQKGAGRYAQGVAVGQPDYQEGFAPYAQVIESTSLPPRKPKGDPSNIERVRALAAALSARKVGAGK